MKNLIFALLLLLVLPGCSNDGPNNNNPYLPNYNFTIDIDMELPAYSNLQFTANAKYIDQAGIGINGIIVFNTGSGFTAFDATCPNQNVSSCSRLTLNGINAVCPCDNQEYSLFTGRGQLKYPLKAYRVQQISPTVIRVYN